MKSFYTGRPFIYSSLVLVLVVFGLIALPAFTSVSVSCHKSPLNQITAIRSTLSLYVKDNNGMLPDNLDALLPYTTNKQLVDNIDFLTPGRKFSELPPKTVILRREYRDENIEAVLYADKSAAAQKMGPHRVHP
jgi:hypothetical protein